jgi:hypothetical protein
MRSTVRVEHTCHPPLPATVDDARGMLWPALEDPDPVLIFEHASLYGMEGELAAHSSASQPAVRKARSIASTGASCASRAWELSSRIALGVPTPGTPERFAASDHLFRQPRGL